MTSNTQMVTYALQDLGVLFEGQTASSAQVNDGMTKLNQMMAQWQEIEDKNLGYSPQSSGSATCPVPAFAELAIRSNLAVMLGPTYDKPIPPDLTRLAMDSKERLTAAIINQNIRQADMSHMPQGRVKSKYDINNDTF